jgi:hypothetical protein
MSVSFGLQYGCNIALGIFNKFKQNIPENIPKIAIPILCGVPILYYITKKWWFHITVEDNYQHVINNKNNTTQSVIDSIAIYDENSINTINYEVLFAKLEKFNENYNKLSANKIKDTFLFKTKKDFLDCKQYHYKLWLDIENRKLYAKLNHELIGGSNIGKFCYTAFAKEQIDNFYHNRFYHIFPAIKLLFNKRSIPRIKNPLPLFENRENIARYMIREIFDRKKNVKAKIIYHIMQRLYYCLGIKQLNRDLVCILPIAFYNTKNINNNIGIMWLTFNEMDTVDTVKRKMEKNAYQIFGTNFLLSNGLLSAKSSSKNTRNNVDAVITILFTKDINNIQVSWSYPSVADYPVYVAVHSRLSENTVHLTQTYTVNTPNFEPGELEKAEHNYLFENS